MPSIRGALRAVLIIVLGCLALKGAARAEVMRAFDAAVSIHRDASFDVRETITMDFQGLERHGIYRMIPWRYRRGGKTVDIRITVLGVSGSRGAIPYRVTREGSYLRVRIGDPDRTVTGSQTYEISYRVRGALPLFDGRPELYWNVTGDQWPYPILSATARVFPPSGVGVEDVKVRSFRGDAGSTTPAEMVRRSDRIVFRTTALYPGQQLTVVVGLPPGSTEETLSDALARTGNAPWWGLLFPLLALGSMARAWWLHGRDIDAGKPAAIEWEPPKDLSPAEVGTLVDEKCDMADVLSTVVDLAVRGFLTIREEETRTFLFLSSKDYVFTRTAKPAGADLAEHENLFLIGLFGGLAPGPADVRLSDLKEKFYTHLPGIRDAIYESLTKRGLFNGNPQKTRGAWAAGGLVLAALAGASLFLWPGAWLPLRLGLVAAGGVVAAWSGAMPSRTAAGSDLTRLSLGFQRFVRATEKDRIAVLAKNDPTLFGRLLPYAMVLGVADQWANAFRDLMREPPDWYSSPHYVPGRPFTTAVFVNDLGNGMKTMGGAFASSPSSSGGSGFSGGGGGGFGGGGGGSW